MKMVVRGHKKAYHLVLLPILTTTTLLTFILLSTTTTISVTANPLGDFHNSQLSYTQQNNLEMVKGITISKDLHFTLHGLSTTYSFFVHPTTKELIHTHFGSALADGELPLPLPPTGGPGWYANDRVEEDGNSLARAQREFPDLGRGDVRSPAFLIKHKNGTTVTHFTYVDYEVKEGKDVLPGLPSTFGSKESASTLLIHLEDRIAKLSATLSYTIFPSTNAIARSVSFTNHADEQVTIERASSFSVDLAKVGGHGGGIGGDKGKEGEWEMVHLSGDWSREMQINKRPVYLGMQGIQSLNGYSSHVHNPFMALTSPGATETTGEAYGFSLIYSGSFSATAELGTTGLARVLIGLNPMHLSWPLEIGETFTTPEAVAVYSSEGLGGMSRNLHRLYRDNLSRSEWTKKVRPALINNWEATYFDFDEDSLYAIAEKASTLGVKLFVMDDGWFGNGADARTDDKKGLGDWVVNAERFPKGLDHFVDRINSLKGKEGKENMRMGLWVEGEMVNPTSKLYKEHPDWVLHSGEYERTEQRHQLVLNFALKEVQDYIIDSISKIFESANISYCKWDNNRAQHELPTPDTSHRYMLGLYHVMDTLTTRFPYILFEGCASGGGRFDPGILHYWPQSWTSDNTDAVDRLSIQFGTSIAMPASSMGGHVSIVPNHQTHRVTPLEFRAHVAMMCGSFGFELDLNKLPEAEQAAIPGLIALSEKINPLVINGEMIRLSRPDESNWPAVLYVSEDKSEAVLLAYQVYSRMNWSKTRLQLQGLEPNSTYLMEVSDKDVNSEVLGSTLMASGVPLPWSNGDYQSMIVFFTKEV